MCLTFFKAAGSFYRNDALHLKTLCIGPSIYDVHEKIGFLTPLPVHMSQTPPCGRPHAVDMKYTSLSWNGEYNDLPDLKLKFDYMIVIYLKLYY